MKPLAQELKKNKTKLLHPLPSIPKRMYWILGFLTFFLYASTITHGYVLDDIAVVEQNKYVQQGVSGIPHILTTFYWHGFTDANVGLFRPVSLIMFAIEHDLNPDSASLHHFMNVLFYILSLIILLRLLHKLMPTINPWFLFFVTLFFAIHPIHSEVVSNIKSRDEIMAFFFFLITCHFFYRNTERSYLDTILSALFFFLALLSKEGTIALLPILVLFELKNKASLKKTVISFVPLFLVTIVWLMWHQIVIGKSEITNYDYHDNSILASSSFAIQKATALGIFFRYEIKAFYPYIMSYDYSYPYFKIVGWTSVFSWLGLVSLIAGLFGIFWFFNRKFILSVGLSLLLFPLLFTGNILFNIGSTMADRFLFVSVLGAGILLVLGIGKLRKTIEDHSYIPSKIAVILLPIFLIFCYKTAQRNLDWKSNEVLFTKDYQTAPESARVLYNYAILLQQKNQISPNISHVNQAIKIFEKSLSLDSGYTEAYISLGRLYIQEKLYSNAKTTFNRGIKLFNKNPDLWGGKGESEFYLNEKDSAKISLKHAMKLGNTSSGVFIIAGTIAFEKNELAEAEKIFKSGLKYHSRNSNLLMNIGNVYGASKNFTKAKESFEQVRVLEPNNAQAIYFLALTYQELQQNEKAQEMMNLYNQLTSKKEY